MTWSADLAVLAERAARWNTPQAHAEFRSSSVARMREYQAHAAFAAACSPERIKVLCELAEAARAYVYACDRHSWNALGGFGALGDALAAVEALEKEEA